MAYGLNNILQSRTCPIEELRWSLHIWPNDIMLCAKAKAYGQAGEPRHVLVGFNTLQVYFDLMYPKMRRATRIMYWTAHPSSVFLD